MAHDETVRSSLVHRSGNLRARRPTKVCRRLEITAQHLSHTTPSPTCLCQ